MNHPLVSVEMFLTCFLHHDGWLSSNVGRSRGNWASRARNAATRWPDSEGFLRLTLLFLPPPQLFFFLPPLAFHLFSSPTCSGNTADFYLYAQMLWRYGLVGHLHISPCSRALRPPLLLFPRPFILCGGSLPFASSSLFFTCCD